ncbi:MAG TPA: hypothetical protein VMZ91_05525 [Candidatus Paceibacterota bacterium]|nr:hypothetical protein [Candidatus Paceibacterota bacterium]
MMKFCPFCESNNLTVWSSGDGYCYHCHQLYTAEQIYTKRESNKKFEEITLF